MPAVYLDVTGYTLRTVQASDAVAYVTTKAPGFLESRIASFSSLINSRLRKRYCVPFGTQPSPLVAQGTNPPKVTLTGSPAVGSYIVQIQITTAGGLGTAVFQWSLDAGVTWTAGVTTASSVVLGSTGLTAVFPSGTYSIDNLYAATTPVPETILGWLVALLTPDMYRKRGVNPQDPQIELIEKDRDRALAEIKEAADSQDGLFDLPVNETQASSAITVGGPITYSEQSPYVWADRQVREGIPQDGSGSGGSYGR